MHIMIANFSYIPFLDFSVPYVVDLYEKWVNSGFILVKIYAVFIQISNV